MQDAISDLLLNYLPGFFFHQYPLNHTDQEEARRRQSWSNVSGLVCIHDLGQWFRKCKQFWINMTPGWLAFSNKRSAKLAFRYYQYTFSPMFKNKVLYIFHIFLDLIYYVLWAWVYLYRVRAFKINIFVNLVKYVMWLTFTVPSFAWAMLLSLSACLEVAVLIYVC